MLLRPPSLSSDAHFLLSSLPHTLLSFLTPFIRVAPHSPFLFKDCCQRESFFLNGSEGCLGVCVCGGGRFTRVAKATQGYIRRFFLKKRGQLQECLTNSLESQAGEETETSCCVSKLWQCCSAVMPKRKQKRTRERGGGGVDMKRNK